MKTERLYYNDPHLLEFEARIIECVRVGDKFRVILDRTAFYPTSGGQPHDLGSINGIPVLDVYEDEESGAIVHVLPEESAVENVRAVIDASRRRDHMQQHSGQHVLSQAFVELFQWPTVSFHLGVADATIDLPVETVSRDSLEQAEALANSVVHENRPVSVSYVSHEDISSVSLRKPTEIVGDVRIIDITGFDRSACGGTHVLRTGEIGSVLITGTERVKKQTRVHFLCGNRVLQYARHANRTLEAISQTLSVGPLDSAQAVRNVWDELQKSRKRLEEVESALLDHEASTFPVQSGLAIELFQNRGVEAIKLLAAKICSRPGVVALLGDVNTADHQIRLVVARSADRNIDAAAILKKVMERFGGRGGGRPMLAQGGGMTAENAREVLDYAATLVQ